MVTRYACVVCGKLTAGRKIMKNIEFRGSICVRTAELIFPRRHTDPQNPFRLCPGVLEEARIVEVPWRTAQYGTIAQREN
jgi:hypothetical protein